MAMPRTEPAVVNISEVIDHCRVGSLQVGLFILCALCLIIDGFDVQAMGYVAPALQEHRAVRAAALAAVGLGALTAGGSLLGRTGTTRLLGIALVVAGLVLTAPAVRTVLPLDDAPSLDLMSSASGERLPVQDALVAAAGAGEADVRWLSRTEFYDEAGGAYLVVRTGETRTYGNVIVRKGVVDPEQGR